MPSKSIRLRTPYALIDVLEDESKPAPPGHRHIESHIMPSRLYKEDAIALVHDFKLMRKELNRCGYEIEAFWNVGLDGTVTKNKPRRKLLRPKRKLRRKRKLLRRR